MNAQSAADFFDHYAHDFAAIYGNENRAVQRLINTLFRRSMRERYERTLAACHPIEGRSVLDIGCGPGHYSVALAQNGAQRVVGIDFAPAMIKLARERAEAAGVAERCDFMSQDFMAYKPNDRFDYVVCMGFMDYIPNSQEFLSKVNALTGRKALFSFPVSHGLLAWQRRIRYRTKTPLYMYSRNDINNLFALLKDLRVNVHSIGRDYFVTAERFPPAGK